LMDIWRIFICTRFNSIAIFIKFHFKFVRWY
jgi:hypothetical protein